MWVRICLLLLGSGGTPGETLTSYSTHLSTRVVGLLTSGLSQFWALTGAGHFVFHQNLGMGCAGRWGAGIGKVREDPNYP